MTRGGGDRAKLRAGDRGRTFLSRNTRNDLSLSRFPSVKEDRALIDRIIRTWYSPYDKYEKGERRGSCARCSHEEEEEDSLPASPSLPGRDRESPTSLHG